MNDTETNDLLHEMVLWLRFQNRSALQSRLRDVLSSDSDKIIYDQSDGTASQPEIAKAAGVSQPTVSTKWKAWRQLGIVYEIEGGRCRHLADLRSVGIDPPALKVKEKSQ